MFTRGLGSTLFTLPSKNYNQGTLLTERGVLFPIKGNTSILMDVKCFNRHISKGKQMLIRIEGSRTSLTTPITRMSCAYIHVLRSILYPQILSRIQTVY